MNKAERLKNFRKNKERWQHELRHKLEREAFNQKYKCHCCGKKDDLHIHHLLYTGDKEGFFDKRYWLILCQEHHMKAGGKLPRKKRRKKLFKDLFEKIFRRKELAKYKTSAALLEKDVDEKDRLIKLLTSGYTVHLNQRETQMILLALRLRSFREMIELPITKVHIRIIYRELREKIEQHLKEDHETKEDDETKEVKIENL